MIEFVVCPVARNMVTVTILWSLILKFKGSDTASAPLGIEIEELPEKVTF